MANISKISVGEEDYNIVIGSGLTEDEQAQVRANIGAVSALGWLDILYPVGGNPYIQYPGTPTPAERFPGTSWEIDTTYQGLVTIGSGGEYVFGAKGGEAEHILTLNESPSHVHLEYVSDGNYTYTIVGSNNASTGKAAGLVINGSYRENAERNIYTANAGGGQAHNNMQPYVVVNYWKRTA